MSPAFGELTGKGVRIAVIDSGVHAAHPHVNGVAKAVAIGRADVSGEDILGHGTAVLAAIKEKAPEAEYIAVRVYYESLRTSVSVLSEAVRWALAERVDIINMSLGTTNGAHRDTLAELAAEAAQQGVLLVSAADAEGVPALPGCLPNVMGVSVDWECPRDSFRRANGRWYASGFPRPLAGVPPRRNLHGVSFAVAAMSGFAARACQTVVRSSPNTRSTAAIEAALEREAWQQPTEQR